MKLIDSILLSAKMQKCHTTVKRLYGDSFIEKMEFYTEAIQAVMAKDNVCATQAVLTISKIYEGTRDHGYAVMMFTAAAVELLLKEENQKENEQQKKQ